MLVQFGEWLPDLPAVGINQLRRARNVLPLDNLSYAPISGNQESFTALGARCTGVYSAKEQDLSVRLFCGTAAALYSTTSGPAWTDVSKVGGYLSGSNHWKFAELNFRIFATNYGDPIQTWLLGTSTDFADLSVNAPKARYSSVWFPGFLVVAGTNDTTDGERPNRVWWPAFGDPTSWPTPGTAAAEAVQSDFRDLDSGGAITGITGPVGGAAGAVFCQNTIYRVDYEGPPTIFRIFPVEQDRGTVASQSIVPIGASVFYLGRDGFYVFDGVQSTSIGSRKVDKTFMRNLDQGNIARVYGVADPINKVAMWFYPDRDSDGTPNMILAYNWETGRWSDAEMSVELAAQFFTPSYTIDGIDSFGSIDAITPSFDSRFWLGGSPSLALFSPDHKMGFLNGDHLEATIETGDLFSEDGRSLILDRVKPHVDGGTVTVAGGYRDTQDADDENVSYTANASAENDGTHIIRGRGKYTRARITVAAGGEWRHASGFDATANDGGAR